MRFSCTHCGGITELEIIDTDYVGCGHCEEVVEVPKSRFDKNTVIAGDFVILEKIGIGGMGLVFKAHQISLERIVALKILKDSFCQNERFIHGFITEARSAAQLRHKNIVQAYAVGHDNGAFYIALEYIQGPTTADMMLQNHIFSEQEVLDIALQMSHALDHAWTNNQLLHRDIKPDNIMIDQNGHAKLMDLGLACPHMDSENGEADEVLGTPQYISPEQLTGCLMDFRGDQYSLGATLFHLLTNQFPFDGETATETALMNLNVEVTPPHLINPKISQSISKIVCKMMEKSPDKRFLSSQGLIEALESCRSPQKKKIIQKKKQTIEQLKTLQDNIHLDDILSPEEQRKLTKTKKPTHLKAQNSQFLKYSAIASISLFIISALIIFYQK